MRLKEYYEKLSPEIKESIKEILKLEQSQKKSSTETSGKELREKIEEIITRYSK